MVASNTNEEDGQDHKEALYDKTIGAALSGLQTSGIDRTTSLMLAITAIDVGVAIDKAVTTILLSSGGDTSLPNRYKLRMACIEALLTIAREVGKPR